MYDDEHDDHDNNFVEIPVRVRLEIDRIKKGAAGLAVAANILVPLVRKYFEQDGGKPDLRYYGGYIEILQQLGITPKSTDPFVQNPAYNVHHAVNIWGGDKEEAHRGQVRLLRFQ